MISWSMSWEPSAKRARLEANRYTPVLGITSSTSSLASRTTAPRSSTSATALTAKTKCRGAAANPERVRSTPVSRNSEATAIRRCLPRWAVLKALKVQDQTLVRYHKAVQDFDQFQRNRRLKPRNIAAVDQCMAEFFADLCDMGQSYNSATYVLFGYLLLRANEPVPHKMLMPQSRAALKGWGSRYPQSTRTGADPLIWSLNALHLADAAPLLAAALLVQLDVYARPSEILNVRKADVIRPTSKQCSFWGIIFGNAEREERTKTQLQDDTVLLNSPDRGYAKTLLQMVYSRAKRPHDKLFGDYTLAEYEALLKEAKRNAGLGAIHLTPHAVRHSGPSFDSLHKTRTLTEIMARGRWQSLKSVQRYQKPGRLLLNMGKIDNSIWVEARASLPQPLSRLRQCLRGGQAP